jgi:hypothetical protein
MSTPSDLRESAHRYLDMGLSVIPTNGKKPNWDVLPQEIDQEKGTKRGVWHEFRERFPTESELNDWFSDSRTTGLAGVGGHQSGNVLVVDFDSMPTFREWYGRMPAGLVENLPWSKTNQGMHLWVRCADPGHNMVLAAEPNPDKPGRGKALIETRAEGGYALLPPSLHPSGRHYEAVRGNWGQIPVVDMELVNTIFTTAISVSPTPIALPERRQRLTRDQRRSNTPADQIVDEFNQRVNLVSLLESYGYRARFGRGLVRPGGKKTTVYILPAEGGLPEMSYHHNSADALWCGPERKARSAFAIVKELEFGGDKTRALAYAARYIGKEWKDPDEFVRPQTVQKPKEQALEDWTIPGDQNVVILTDNTRSGQILRDTYKVSTIVGPHAAWPRHLLPHVRRFAQRYVCFSNPADGAADMTALEMEALVADVRPPLPVFFEEGCSLRELNAFLATARQPVY